jgi:hypothetical protein
MISLKHECMLDIQNVMTYVIKNEIVDFFDDIRLYISGVRYRVVLIGNVLKRVNAYYSVPFFICHNVKIPNPLTT